jgi:hypothetical protein
VGEWGNSKGGEIIIFSMQKETKIFNWEQGFCTPQNGISSYWIDLAQDRER